MGSSLPLTRFAILNGRKFWSGRSDFDKGVNHYRLFYRFCRSSFDYLHVRVCGDIHSLAVFACDLLIQTRLGIEDFVGVLGDHLVVGGSGGHPSDLPDGLTL
jgi:hypothetical protein